MIKVLVKSGRVAPMLPNQKGIQNFMDAFCIYQLFTELRRFQIALNFKVSHTQAELIPLFPLGAHIGFE